jgi:hypothetical protein
VLDLKRVKKEQEKASIKKRQAAIYQFDRVFDFQNK